MTKFYSASLMVGVVFASPLSAATLDLTPDTTRYLSDPSFLPMQGQVSSNLTYGYRSRGSDWQNTDGFLGEHYAIDTNFYSLSYSYGITDRLSVSGSASYFDSVNHYSFSDAPGFDLSVRQFDNPAFSVTYRAIQNPTNGFSVDLQGTFSPSIVANEPGFGSIAMYVNREFKSFTIQGLIGTTFTGSYSAYDTASGTTVDTASQWNYFLGAKGQLRLTPQWAINGGVIYSMDLSDSVSLTRGGLPENYAVSSVSDVSPYIGLSYDIVPNRINVSLEYDHDFISKSNFSGDVTGGWVNQSQDLYALHFRVLF